MRPPASPISVCPAQFLSTLSRAQGPHDPQLMARPWHIISVVRPTRVAGSRKAPLYPSRARQNSHLGALSARNVNVSRSSSIHGPGQATPSNRTAFSGAHRALLWREFSSTNWHFAAPVIAPLVGCDAVTKVPALWSSYAAAFPLDALGISLGTRQTNMAPGRLMIVVRWLGSSAVFP